MKVSFNDTHLEELYKTPLDKLKKQKYSREVINHYQKKIDILKFANTLNDVYRFRGLNLEKLNGKEYKGCYSIRINVQFRIIFKVADDNTVEVLILELSKHYE